MGHSGYLDEAYVRLNEAEVAEAYKKNMEKVSVYAVEDLELRKEINQLKKQNIDLKQQLNGQRPEMLKLREELDELRTILKKVIKQEE
jgi:hypothetical protein